MSSQPVDDYCHYSAFCSQPGCCYSQALVTASVADPWLDSQALVTASVADPWLDSRALVTASVADPWLAIARLLLQPVLRILGWL